jgi:predicted acetyltransferase
MADLKLRRLGPGDEWAFRAGLEDWAGEELSWYSFAWKEGMNYLEMLEILDKEHRGIDLPEGRVPATMLYAFVGGEIVGRLSVRHRLNAHLQERGGHMGYAVAPRFRRRGYATQIMEQGVRFCRDELKLDRVLVTCADENLPSWKIIEGQGGVLENRIWDAAEELWVRRYWISLSPAC